MNRESWQKKAALVRKWSLISTTEAGSGHPTSCLSAADIMTVLFDKFFHYDLKNPKNPNNDRLIFSKGHAAPLFYTLFALSGGLPLEGLKTLRKFGSRLEGHPTPEFPYTEVATGSLGQGLSVGAGLAYGIQKESSKFNPSTSLRARVQSSKLPKVFVLLGDGEVAEGNVWEAANFSSYYHLGNLIAIVDVNRFGQSQETMFGHHTEEYVQRFSSFGWEVVSINGHNFEEIEKAFNLAVRKRRGKPFAIIAKTKKGKGVSVLEDRDGWHGKPLKKEDLPKALEELGEIDDKLRFKLKLRTGPSFARGPVGRFPRPTSSVSLDKLGIPAGARRGSPTTATPLSVTTLNYKLGDQIATREVYGDILAKLGEQNKLIYSLDGDTKNSTYSEKFKNVHPDRFVECFIAEQNMVGVALGLSAFGKIPFVSTFAAFLTRAFDQIRMSAISLADIKFVGSHAGVSIGEDGSSQMGLEDFAMFGALPDSIIFHPSDATSTAKILPLMASHFGISYLRTLRPKTSVIYNNNEKFKIGGSKILRSAQNDILTVVACGITVHEALKAYEILKNLGVMIRVIDCYSVKPIDKKTLEQCCSGTMKKIIITVEDHFEHGGLGDFVLSAVSKLKVQVEKMAVTKIAHSGTKEELFDYVGISAKHIVKRVKFLLQ